MKFKTKIGQNLLVRQVCTDVNVDTGLEHKVLIINQKIVNFAGEMKPLLNANIRFDDIKNTDIGNVKLIQQMEMHILNGLINLFIAAQIIMTAQQQLQVYSLQEQPVRFVLSIVLGIYGLNWLITWINVQFFSGIKTLIVKLKNGEYVELIYNDKLEELIQEAKYNDKEKITIKIESCDTSCKQE